MVSALRIHFYGGPECVTYGYFLEISCGIEDVILWWRHYDIVASYERICDNETNWTTAVPAENLFQFILASCLMVLLSFYINYFDWQCLNCVLN